MQARGGERQRRRERRSLIILVAVLALVTGIGVVGLLAFR